MSEGEGDKPDEVGQQQNCGAESASSNFVSLLKWLPRIFLTGFAIAGVLMLPIAAVIPGDYKYIWELVVGSPRGAMVMSGYELKPGVLKSNEPDRPPMILYYSKNLNEELTFQCAENKGDLESGKTSFATDLIHWYGEKRNSGNPNIVYSHRPKLPHTKDALKINHPIRTNHSRLQGFIGDKKELRVCSIDNNSGSSPDVGTLIYMTSQERAYLIVVFALALALSFGGGWYISVRRQPTSGS